MNAQQVNIRDPFVLLHDGKYYLYGTRSATCWGKAEGFDCYVSENLADWEGPIEIFRRSEDFFSDESFWAPECIEKDGSFYLITTFLPKGGKKGIYVMKSDSPLGPFTLFSERLTPERWACIDGTVYFEDGHPFLVFSHSFEDTPDGDMCAIALSDDLRSAVGEPWTLFSAPDAPWARPVPFAKAEFGMDGDVYFTDGPYLYLAGDGRLYMPWSSWSLHGYAVGTAVSASGKLSGPWTQCEAPLFPDDGGHGMLLRDKTGHLLYVLHYPNTKYEEHPVFTPVEITNGELKLIG